jgi:pyruvate dehydrogenase E2 component (dihydrolipoamide acetyltransferase)
MTSRARRRDGAQDVTDHDTFEYALPSLGADMDEGRVVEWKFTPGDTVHRGDVFAVVETEKSDLDIEIWHDGVIEDFLVDVGQLVDVGTPIARLRATDASAPPTDIARPSPESIASTPPSGRSASTIPASPLARRLAAHQGIDLGAVRGTGPGGAVLEADVVAASGGQGVPAPVSTAAPRRSPDTMRALIAERMATSIREIPHYHLSRDIDVGPLETWLAEQNARRPITRRILPAACFVRAVALAAARHPELNGFWLDDHVVPAESVNVAMAISLRRGGLVTPHLERADERSLDEVMHSLAEMVAAARAGNLRASWMSGATITVTHLGDTGADSVNGVISPPQVALVGFGRTRRCPWVIDDGVVVRPVVTCTLAADHRATDGAIGSRFLATLADLIDQPEDLL